MQNYKNDSFFSRKFIFELPQLKKFSETGLVFLAWTFYVWICATVISTLYFGVEPFDEALYVALPYHLVLGGRSFIDELHTAQTAGLFLYPIMKIFYRLHGSTDGVILFARYLYTCTSITFSAAIYYCFRSFVAKPALVVISTLAIIFVPFNIHALSYNNLAMMFLTSALLWHFSAYVQKKSLTSLFFAAVFLVLAVIAYPTLVLIVPLVAGIFWWYSRESYRLKAILTYLLGFALGSVWFLYLFLRIGSEQMHRFKAYLQGVSQSGEAGGIGKFFLIVKQIVLSLPHAWVFGVLLAFAAIISLLEKRMGVYYSRDNGELEYPKLIRVGLALAILGILITVLGRIHSSDSMFYIRCLALVAPILFLLLVRPASNSLYSDNLQTVSYVRALFYLIGVPAYVAGLISAWSSSNGAYNAAIGFFPAALICLVYVYFAFKKIAELLQWPHAFAVLCSTLFLGYVIYPLYIDDHLKNYADFNSRELTVRVPSGIYKGIYTTPVKSNFYVQLEVDLKAYGHNAKTIFIFDEFPAGYLMTDLLPMTNTLWTYSAHRCPTCNRQATVDYIYAKSMPDIVVQIIGVAENPNPGAYDYYYAQNDPMLGLLSHYHLSLDRPGYKLFTK